MSQKRKRRKVTADKVRRTARMRRLVVGNPDLERPETWLPIEEKAK